MKKIDIKTKCFLGVITLLILLVVGVMIYFLYFAQPVNKAVNDSSNRISDVSIDGLNFANGVLTYEDGLTIFKVTVTNTTKKNVAINVVDFVFRDAKNKVMTTLTGYVGVILAPGDERIISSSVDKDVRTAKDIEYVIKNK